MKKRQENASTTKINRRVFLFPALVWLAGLVTCMIFAPRTVYVNAGVGMGFLLLCLGTVLLFVAIYREVYRCGVALWGPLRALFPCYPIVKDYDAITERLSGFREAFGNQWCKTYTRRSMRPERSSVTVVRFESFGTKRWHTTRCCRHRRSAATRWSVRTAETLRPGAI